MGLTQAPGLASFADGQDTPSRLAEELADQPAAWLKATTLVSERGLLPPAGAKVAAIGCGTSWFMAQAYATMRERAGLGDTDAFTPSEAFLDRGYDRVVAISRSGTTSEILEAVAAIRGKVPVTGIVGDSDSPLPALVDDAILLSFADEQSVVQTRFATTTLALLRASLGENLTPVIADAEDALAVELDDDLVSAEQYTFLGSGWAYAIAREAALKMREASQSWTESYPAMEYRHGPISIAAPGRVTWLFGNAPAGLADQVAATGARFESSERDPMADLIRVQRIALERALRFGFDPDQPRNLTRSVILN